MRLRTSFWSCGALFYSRLRAFPTRAPVVPGRDAGFRRTGAGGWGCPGSPGWMPTKVKGFVVLSGGDIDTDGAVVVHPALAVVAFQRLVQAALDLAEIGVLVLAHRIAHARGWGFLLVQGESGGCVDDPGPRGGVASRPARRLGFPPGHCFLYRQGRGASAIVSRCKCTSTASAIVTRARSGRAGILAAPGKSLHPRGTA